MTYALKTIAIVALLTACAPRKRLSAEPCMPIEAVAARSSGFDPEDLRMSSELGMSELDLPRERWALVEWTDGEGVLLALHDVPAGLRAYDGRVAVLYAGPDRSMPLTELDPSAGGLIRHLREKGFEVSKGSPEAFLSMDRSKRLRSILLQRGDYLLHLAFELADTRPFFRLTYVAESVGACRSPEMLKWLTEHRDLHEDRYR